MATHRQKPVDPCAGSVGPLPPEPVRVAVSLDRPLLERIDQEASRRGMTRSGFLAEGARTLLGA